MIQKKAIGTILRGPFFFNSDIRERPVMDMVDEAEERNTQYSESMRAPLFHRDFNLTWSNLLPADTMLEEEPSSTMQARDLKQSSKKKRSLKFCRRLCKGVLTLLEREKFTMKAFTRFGSIVASFLGHMDAYIIDRKKFDNVTRVLFTKIWKRNRQLVTSKHNKKICLVTQNEWDSFFEFTEFVQEFEKNSEGLKDLLELIACDGKLSKEVFVGLYQRVLFILHMVFINSVIHCELTKDKKFLDRVPNYENFAMMVVEPWLYKHHNHSKNMFALECCGKCKVCRSGSIPPEFLTKLNIARLRFAEIKNLFSSFDNSVLIEFSDEEVSSIFVFCARRHNEGCSLTWAQTDLE